MRERETEKEKRVVHVDSLFQEKTSFEEKPQVVKINGRKNQRRVPAVGGSRMRLRTWW